MKFRNLFLCLLFTFIGCHPTSRHYILINETGNNITVYQPIKIPLKHSDLYQAFKPTNSDNAHIRFDFFVKPYSKRENFRMGTFGSQFNTSDGKLHLIVLDMDTLRLLAKNRVMDSVTIKRAILKHLVFTEAELESAKRMIKYEK